MLYKSKLTAHSHEPTVPDDFRYVQNERQWLLLKGGSSRCAFLHVYIACQTRRDTSFMQWNEDLFSLITQEALDLKQQGFMIMAMGDFNSRVGRLPSLEDNTPDNNKNTKTFMRFVEEIHLLIVNTLPISRGGVFSRFDDDKGNHSLLDYALISSENSDLVSSFVIDENARISCGSDHALLLCKFRFDH